MTCRERVKEPINRVHLVYTDHVDAEAQEQHNCRMSITSVVVGQAQVLAVKQKT